MITFGRRWTFQWSTTRRRWRPSRIATLTGSSWSNGSREVWPIWWSPRRWTRTLAGAHSPVCSVVLCPDTNALSLSAQSIPQPNQQASPVCKFRTKNVNFYYPPYIIHPFPHFPPLRTLCNIIRPIITVIDSIDVFQRTRTCLIVWPSNLTLLR